jgi:hypothetical protein
LQDKLWVHGPGQEPREVYVVKGDADRLDKNKSGVGCCGASPASTPLISLSEA